jgi:hypothetical protein
MSFQFHNPVLKGIFMVDELPTGDKAMYAFLEMIALALVFAAVENFIANKPWYVWSACLGLAILFFIAGIKWPTVKSAMGTRFSLSLSLTLFVLVVLAGVKWPQTRLRLAVLLGGYACIYSVVYVRSLRRDIEVYVKPRNLTKKQIEDLRKSLSGRNVHPLTVKVNPLDREAFAYASQFFGVFKQAAWDVTLNTSSDPPTTLHDGLTTTVMGSNAGPPDPKRNPQMLLQQALMAAHIEVNGGGAVGAGAYALFLVVGHRPLKLSSPPPFLRKLIAWLSRMTY